MIKVIDNIDYEYYKILEYKIKNKTSLNSQEIDYFLSIIVYLTRQNIMENGNYYFDYKCDLAQSIICNYLNDLNVRNYPNSTQASISPYITGHSFLVATFNVNNQNINYLIDPTYIQFFRKENCNDDKYQYANGYIIKTPDPGYFVKEEERDIINTFNYNGYAVMTDEMARIYGDSFYNTKVMDNDKKFKTMKGYVYINSFIKGKEKLSKSKEELIKEGYYLDFVPFEMSDKNRKF